MCFSFWVFLFLFSCLSYFLFFLSFFFGLFSFLCGSFSNQESFILLFKNEGKKISTSVFLHHSVLDRKFDNEQENKRISTFITKTQFKNIKWCSDRNDPRLTLLRRKRKSDKCKSSKFFLLLLLFSPSMLFAFPFSLFPFSVVFLFVHLFSRPPFYLFFLKCFFAFCFLFPSSFILRNLFSLMLEFIPFQSFPVLFFGLVLIDLGTTEDSHTKIKKRGNLFLLCFLCSV